MPVPAAARTSMHFLEQHVGTVKGVGGRRGDALEKAGVRTVRDLLHYYPRRYLDRSSVTPIRALRENEPATVVGTVRVSGVIPGRSNRFELIVEDDAGGRMTCVWFRGTKWISKLFSNGDRVAFHGKPQRFGGAFSMPHPDFDRLEAEAPALDTGRIIALYAGGSALERVGLHSRAFRRILYNLFKERGTDIPEVLPRSVREGADLIDGRVALRAAHFPRNRAELEAARRRLKFEELFFIQLMLAMLHRRWTARPGPVFDKPGERMPHFLRDVLPFELTPAQQAALRDVLRDTRSGNQMNRLVQGDVGSGKTVVAVAAMLHALDNGFQSAFMAPTEILAEQHYAILRGYLDALGVETRLLVGRMSRPERDRVLADLAQGRVHAAVGTHALIQEGVTFHRLGLAVVDEQHRFGVAQRARMLEMGERPHMLLMTATPIPRSLAMTIYGDLDVSVMDELPAGRRPVRTALRYEKHREEVYRFVDSELEKGRQCYVVYPLVEESEKLDLKDAQSGHDMLADVFKPHAVDLVHGRMSSAEKEEAMRRFYAGETQVLVATTVIEVGVDVPNATVMVIEHAERFGLSQLHQLRGRVGRGAEQSYCILMADYRRTNEARERLQAMIATTDGFEISETDLKLRGAGDFFGTKQSGLPDLKIADLVEDRDVLATAREIAFDLVRRDADLSDHPRLRAYFEAFYAEQSLGFARVG